MYKKQLLLLIISLLFLSPLFTEAQQHWMVYFKEKQHSNFNPYSYFDSKAIERRIRTGIPVDDPSDWPVNEKYIKEIAPFVNEVILTSRWFNAVAVDADVVQIGYVANLFFVLGIEEILPSQSEITEYGDYDTILDQDKSEILSGQLNTLGANEWRKSGFDGKGIRIAIFDVGFVYADKVPAFDHIRSEKRLIATRDFSRRGNSEDVFYGNGHGTQVWSCIAGQIGDIQIGLATGAEFLLAKTERNSEKYSEELHWLAAAEWADKNGADIINSSLGYTDKRYFNWQMDGRTSFISRAANIAARKGILVVTAAGNEGDNSWHYIGAPADADSALSVGGIDPATGYHTGFSSYGPTSDKRLKPNVVAFGHVVAAAGSGLRVTQGTSFSSPLVAGFAACAWQSRKEMTSMQLFKEIEKSGDIFPYFDYAHGYGIPQAAYFLNKEVKTIIPSFRIIESGDSISVVVNNFHDTGESMQGNSVHNAEQGSEDGTPFEKKYMFYNIMNKEGVLDTYYVLDVTQPEVISMRRSDYKNGETLNIHYAGYSLSIKL
jgi:subtilisin family serine protease